MTGGKKNEIWHHNARTCSHIVIYTYNVIKFVGATWFLFPHLIAHVFSYCDCEETRQLPEFSFFCLVGTGEEFFRKDNMTDYDQTAAATLLSLNSGVTSTGKEVRKAIWRNASKNYYDRQKRQRADSKAELAVLKYERDALLQTLQPDVALAALGSTYAKFQQRTTQDAETEPPQSRRFKHPKGVRIQKSEGESTADYDARVNRRRENSAYVQKCREEMKREQTETPKYMELLRLQIVEFKKLQKDQERKPVERFV
jgi:hypothetical protein